MKRCAAALAAGACVCWIAGAWLARRKWGGGGRRRFGAFGAAEPPEGAAPNAESAANSELRIHSVQAASEPPEPVTFLKPLKPGDTGSVARVARLLELAGTQDQVIAGCDSTDEGTVGRLAQLASASRDSRLRIVVTPPSRGVNPKIAKLREFRPHIRHRAVVVTDSEVLPEAGWIREVRGALATEPTALVTCAYRFRGMQTAAEILDAAAPGLFLWPGAALRMAFGRPDFAFGALLGFSRPLLDRFGGFDFFLHHLADDHAFAAAWSGAGLPVRVLDEVVTLESDRNDWPGLWRHQLRVARTYREAAPLGFAGSAFVNLWVAASLAVVAFPSNRALAACVVCLIRWQSRRAVGAALGENERTGSLPVLFAGSAVELAAWIASWLPLAVNWGGIRFRVRRGRFLPSGHRHR